MAGLSVASVWPVLHSQTIPAFQQDWTWPLSRALSLQWLHAFIGLWDVRSLGQANALPWQTYAVVTAVAMIAVFGTATGLAVWIAAVQCAAAYGCMSMLYALGVRSWPARLIAALLYALGPVAFVRLSAGHLAYLVGYALLPFAIALTRAVLERARVTTAVALGVIAGLAGCQIQFLAMWIIAAVPLIALTAKRSAGWELRLSIAAAIALAVQLQALLAIAFSSTAALYAAQPPLRNFEYNNSARLGDAAIMLGYFTHYYERHALAGTAIALYALLIASAVISVWGNRRSASYGIILVVIGVTLTAGLYGPLGGILTWSFARVPGFAVFRDLHYFAALTALGVTICLGISLQRLHPLAAVPALALVVWICVPTIGGSALRSILVPRTYVADALSVMQTAHARGPGRVLWLPAQEPVGLRGSANKGRDFTAYGPSGNPSVSDDHQNPQLSYALATLLAGRPDWNAFSTMNIRYIVDRRYVVSNRGDNFGTGFPLRFGGVSDAQRSRLLQHAKRLTMLRTTAESTLYELSGAPGNDYLAHTDPNAMLYSQLRPHTVAVDDDPTMRLDVTPSNVTADPRADWVADTLGRRYRLWLADSIYPFVWTVSRQPLQFSIPHSNCVVAGADGAWNRYRVAAGATMRPGLSLLRLPANQLLVRSPSGEITAVMERPCAMSRQTGAGAFIFASGYDTGWRAIEGGRWMRPKLANGWMMAWLGIGVPSRLVYLPAYAQLVGFIATVLIVVLAFVRATPPSS